VRDTNGRALAGALVEIWQACNTGKYNHPRIPTPRRSTRLPVLGPHHTDAGGNYSFLTISRRLPRGCRLGAPPHIHFKIAAPGSAR